MSQAPLPEALKTFTHAFDIRVFVDQNAGDWQMPMEWHTSLEIFFALRGEGRCIVGEKTYRFQSGDIFVIGNNELHKSEIVEGGQYDALLVMFSPDSPFIRRLTMAEDPLRLFYLHPQGFSHRLRPTAGKQQVYRGITALMLEEYGRSGSGGSEALTALLTWLLLDLNREYAAAGPLPPDVQAGERVKHKKIITEVLDYIGAHFCEDINFGELAGKLYVNQSYLSREFRKSTGYSLSKFLSNKRIREARELLRSTEWPVSEIASRVGYNNISHFNWIFKKEIGISPREFRKKTSEVSACEN